MTVRTVREFDSILKSL